MGSHRRWLGPAVRSPQGVAGIGSEIGRGSEQRWGSQVLAAEDRGRHAKAHQVYLHLAPTRLGAAGTPDPGWSHGLWVWAGTKGQRV